MTIIYKSIGLVSLAAGVVGAFLPLMPTTCFVLLSAWIFAKSSPSWHARLVNNRYFGRAIQHWEQHKTIPKKARRIAIGSMLASGVYSCFMLDTAIAKFVILSLLGLGIWTVSHFKENVL